MDMQLPQGFALDNPAWFALTTRQARLRQGDEFACRYHADIAPFAGAAVYDKQALARLGQLAGGDGFVMVLTTEKLPRTSGLEITLRGTVCQMISAENPVHDPGVAVMPLGAGDVADMIALTQSTQPGPFAARTHEMGNYLGVREQGRLIAMAGERMQVQGFTEISAVCVSDEHRGRGLAAALVNVLRGQILARGHVPFLHVFEDNQAAIGLYQRLGFKLRQKFLLYKIAGGRNA